MLNYYTFPTKNPGMLVTCKEQWQSVSLSSKHQPLFHAMRTASTNNSQQKLTRYHVRVYHAIMFWRHLSLWDTHVRCASELTQLKHNASLEPNAASRHLTALLTPCYLFLLAFLQLPDS